MTTSFVESLPLGKTMLFYGLVVVFVLPAWRWVQKAMPRQSEDAWTRAAIAFALAFGFFTLASGPLLLLHASTQTAIYVLLTTWGVTALAIELWLKRTATEVPAIGLSEVVTEPSWSHPQLPRMTLVFAVLSLLTAVAMVAKVLPRRPSLLLLILFFVANLALAWRSRNCTQQSDAPKSGDGGERLLLLLWFCLIAFALISPNFFFRTDADDNLYLSEALQLSNSEAMATYAPTHRGEQLPMNPIYAWQSFELWAALLARFSGLHTMIVLRSLCAPLLLLISLALYRGILRRILPPPLLLTGMVFLTAYFVFGMSSHWTPNNYFLSRPQQGKTWLMHIGIVALVLQSIRYLERPSWKAWAALLLLSFACLGWAPTSVLIIPALLCAFALGHLIAGPSLKNIFRVLPLAAALLPQIIFAIYISTQQDAILVDVTLNGDAGASWTDLFFFKLLENNHAGGGLELLTLVLTPVLFIGLPKLRRQAFPLGFCIALFLLFLNPFSFVPIRDFLGSETSYFRLFWLLPFPLLVACLGALLVSWIPAYRHGSTAKFGVVLASLCIFPLCGAHLVWSTDNIYSHPDEGTFLLSVENPYKISAGLIDVAQALTELPTGPEQRILCHLNEVQQLAPLVKEFNFVYARSYQTLAPLILLDRKEEAMQRQKLGIEFLSGGLLDSEAAPLLRQEKAQYVVLGPITAHMAPQLLRLDYSLRLESGEFSLWVRD